MRKWNGFSIKNALHFCTVMEKSWQSTQHHAKRRHIYTNEWKWYSRTSETCNLKQSSARICFSDIQCVSNWNESNVLRQVFHPGPNEISSDPSPGTLNIYIYIYMYTCMYMYTYIHIHVYMPYVIPLGPRRRSEHMVLVEGVLQRTHDSRPSAKFQAIFRANIIKSTVSMA